MTGRTSAVTGLVAVVAVLFLLLGGDAAALHPADPWTGAALGAVLALAGALQVHVRHRGNTEALDLFDVVLAVCAIAFGPVLLVVVATAAKALSQAWQRVALEKAAFNVATAAASAAAVGCVLSLLPSVPLLPALALGLLAGWAANHLALVAVLSAAGVRREVVTAAAVARWGLLGAVCGALGLLLALAWVADPTGVLLFAVPLAALHRAGLSLATAAGERRRLSASAAASRVLSAGTAADLPDHLAQLRAAFGAQAAVLLPAPAVSRAELEQTLVCSRGDELSPALVSWLAQTAAQAHDDDARRLVPGLPDAVEVLGTRLPGQPGTLLAVVDPGGHREALSTELATTAAAAVEVQAFLRAQQLRTVAEQQHRRLELVMAAVTDGIVTVGADGRVLSCNAAVTAMTGRVRAEVLDADVRALGLRAPSGQLWEVPTEATGSATARLELTTREGARRVVDAGCAPIVLDGERCAVLALRDVTAQVEQERARSQFVIGLGHELRTPLTPLLGWSRTLRRRPEVLDTQRQLVLDALSQQSERLARLVENLLAAVDPQALVREREDVDLAALVQAQVDALGAELDSRPVRVVDTGAGTVLTSPTAVRQVVANLLTNLARYTPSGSSAHVLLSRAGGSVVLEVVDEGPGVPPELREEIFGLFAHGTEVDADPGAGVGLAIARSLARALGGDLLCVDPAQVAMTGCPGPAGRPAARGAAFRLVLPLRPGAYLAPRAEDPLARLFAG